VPMAALHVTVREDRAEVVDIGGSFDWLAVIGEQLSVDVVWQVHVADPRGVRAGIAIVAELREPANPEEPAVGEEQQVVLRQAMDGLPLLEDSSEGGLGVLSIATALRLDDREVRV